MKARDPHSSNHADARQVARRLLGILWRGVRQVAWGIDASSSVRHGIDVPHDHGSRSPNLANSADFPLCDGRQQRS